MDCTVARATSTWPSGRRSAGHAIGSTVQNVATSGAPSGIPGAPSTSGSVMVAAGTISRRATRSVSARKPANGRATYGAATVFGAMPAFSAAWRF